MFKFKRTGITRLRVAGCVAMVAASLSACGRNDNSPQPSLGSTETTLDGFTAFVESQVMPLSDTDEPIPIDAVTATAPETTEPNPLG